MNDRRPPPPIVVLAAVAALLFFVPIVALLVDAPWSSIGAVVGETSTGDAIRISMLTSLAATALSIVGGIPLAWVLGRTDFPGISIVRAVVTLPMVLPPVVGGVALLLAFGRRGMFGPSLDAAGIRIPFTTAGVVVAQTFVAMPFLVVTMEAALRSFDARYEEAAATLGAGRWMIFRRVTLPLVAPSLVAGAVLTWARALGEFGATVTFAGNLPGRTQTLPLAAFFALESGAPERAVLLSVILLVPAVLVLLATRRTTGLAR